MSTDAVQDHRNLWNGPWAGPWPLLHPAPAARTAIAELHRETVVWLSDAQSPRRVPTYCPHRGVGLEECRVVSGRVKCPYHGLELDGEAGGMFRFMGSDWIGEPNAAVQFLQAQRGDLPATCFELTAETVAPLALCIENLLDATHTPYVHPALIRSAAHVKSLRAEGRATPWGFEIAYEESGPQSGWIGRWLEPRRGRCYGRWLRPFGAQVDYEAPDGRSYFRATALMRPGRARTVVKVLIDSDLRRMGRGAGLLLRPLVRMVFLLALHQDRDILDRAWRGIVATGRSPADMACARSDLAWRWLGPELVGQTGPEAFTETILV